VVNPFLSILIIKELTQPSQVLNDRLHPHLPQWASDLRREFLFLLVCKHAPPYL
jgi:hypothetical protein